VDLEDVLCSKTTLKVLKTIMRLGQLNVSGIAERLAVNFRAVQVRLDMLESEGILQHRAFGRARYYRLREHSRRAIALQRLFEDWERE
jgi:predicted transcriptional regulator